MAFTKIFSPLDFGICPQVLCALAHRATTHKGAIVTGISLHKDAVMHTAISLGPLVSLLCGVLILIVPRMLNYIVAVYLIVSGLLGLFGDIHLR